jgi:hypothetical protein
MNIPVEYVQPEGSGHAMPRFSVDGWYLSHGDDPYDQYVTSTPQYPLSKLLINQSTWDAWFGSAVATATRKNNIGRRVAELAAIHLPDALLRDYCGDITHSSPHATSSVAEYFSKWYSVAELEALGLWERLADKVALLGGCQQIP